VNCSAELSTFLAFVVKQDADVQALPILLGLGAFGAYAAWKFMRSADGKQLRSQYERMRKQVAPGAPPVGQVLDMEAHPEVESAYQALDKELSDFDARLRQRKRL
jgi:hypothetical protein